MPSMEILPYLRQTPIKLADVKTVVSLGVWQPSQLEYATIRREFPRVLCDAGLYPSYVEVRDPQVVLRTYVAALRDSALDPGDVNVTTFHRDNCGCVYRSRTSRGGCRHTRNANYYLIMWSNILPTELRDSRKWPIVPFPDGSVLLIRNSVMWHRSPKIVPGTQRWFVRVADVREA